MNIIKCALHIKQKERFEVIPQFFIAHPYMRTIFASLARANKRVHVHSERNFPQAKLNGKVNARSLLNKHGGLYFLFHNDSGHIIFFDGCTKIKKNNYRMEKRYRRKRAKNYSGM